MRLDATGVAALIDALGVPAALLLGMVFLFLKYPPRPAPEADLLSEIRRLADAVTALQGPQAKLAEEVNDLALKIAEMSGKLSR